MKTLVFWLCISAVIGAAAWTAMSIIQRTGDSAKTTAERILQARGMTKVTIDSTPGRGDIWCPSGTGSALFTATEKSGRAVKGAICTARNEGIVLTLE